MTFGTYPPSPELVPTDEAARIFGCSPASFRNIMRKYNVEGVRTYGPKKMSYLWHPVVVLQFRAVHAANRRKKPVWKMAHDHQRRVREGRIKARETRLETYGQRVLARIKERQCTTT